MITCKNCNTQLEDGTKFCYTCGTQVAPPQMPDQTSEPNQTQGMNQIPSQSQMAGQTPIPQQMPNQIPMPNQVQTPGQMPMPNQMPSAAQGQVPYPAPMPVPMNAPMQPGKMKPAKSGKSKKLIPAIIIAIAAVALIAVAAVLLPGMLKKGSSKINAGLYLKDGEINYTSLSSIKPRELTQKLFEGSGSSTYGSYVGFFITFNKDGSRIFYPDKISDNDDGLTLYYMNLKSKNSEGQKIDSDITNYQINDAGTSIYYMKGKDNNFYVSNLEDKEKIDSEVTSFYINSNGSKVIYINEDGDIYQKENKKGKEKLDSNASIVYVSEDLSSIYYLKNNALYLKNVGKDKEKLFSDVSSVIHVYDSGEIYYVKSADITYNLSDFVIDDMAATDALIVEPMMPLYPSYDDYLPDMSYPTEPDPSWYTDIWGYYDWDLYDQYYNDYYAQRDEYNAQWQANYDEAVRQYNEAYDEYLAEYDQYFAKQDRDYLRQSIQGVTIPVTNYGLYYYNKKDSILVSDTYADFLSYSYETPLVLFRSNNKAEITKVNLSEVYSFDTLYSSANDSVYSSGEVNAAIKEVMAGVPQEEGGSYIVKPNGELLYYLDNYDSEENSYDLYEVKISNGKMDIPTKIDSGVYSISLAYNSYALVYYKNVKNGAGDLYIDKKPVDSDVYSYSVGAIQDTDEFLYFVDYDEDSYAGTLKIYDGKTSKKVGDDIYSYDVINKDSILYLTDYNIDKARGDLYLYNGTDKKKQIDTDVTSLLTIYMNNSRGYLSSFWY